MIQRNHPGDMPRFCATIGGDRVTKGYRRDCYSMISELFFFLQLSERCDKLPMSPSKWDSVEVLTPFVEAINRHDAKALARWMTVDQVFVYSLAEYGPWR